MRKTGYAVAAIALVTLLLAEPAAAAPLTKTYQITGPVLELTDSAIVIQKNKKDRWEIARTPDTKVSGDLKVGAKVTIQYRMQAAAIEVQPAVPEEPKKTK